MFFYSTRHVGAVQRWRLCLIQSIIFPSDHFFYEGVPNQFNRLMDFKYYLPLKSTGLQNINFRFTSVISCILHLFFSWPATKIVSVSIRNTSLLINKSRVENAALLLTL